MNEIGLKLHQLLSKDTDKNVTLKDVNLGNRLAISLRLLR